MARSDPMADASLPDMRARSRPGTAMAAMMPMIATTISSSINVKPFCVLMCISSPLVSLEKQPTRSWVAPCAVVEQPVCQASNCNKHQQNTHFALIDTAWSLTILGRLTISGAVQKRNRHGPWRGHAGLVLPVRRFLLNDADRA